MTATMTPKQIVQAVRQAGVVGAGGGGYPSYVKLQAQADTVIANGSECEPLLASDKTLLLRNAGRVMDGLLLAMSSCGARKGVVAVKRCYTDVIASVERVLPKDGCVRVHPLDDYYPAGDEFLTVYDVTGRVIPEGGLPPDVGAVVFNVLTLAQIAHAVSGKAVTERLLTVCGSVREPRVVEAPIGTSYADLISAAGGTLNDDDVLLDGGPMMGTLIRDPGLGIGRTTSAVLALPADHLVIRQRKITPNQMVKRSKAACCQCFRCTDLCPRYLLGHNLQPHLTMRTLDYGILDADAVTSAFLCSQCGVCELVACDAMLLSPRRILADIKKALQHRGVKNPHHGVPVSPRSGIGDRRISSSTLRKRIGVAAYVKETPFQGGYQPRLVRVPLNRHAGAAAGACVTAGTRVRMGERIGLPPPDQLGASVHASIAGRVSEVNEEWVEIRAT